MKFVMLIPNKMISILKTRTAAFVKVTAFVYFKTFVTSTPLGDR